MKILMISPHPLEHGGVQTHVKELSAELTKTGVDIVVVCPKRRKEKGAERSKLTANIYELPFCLTTQNGAFVSFLLGRLATKVAQKENVDIIHAHHGFYYGLSGLIAKKLTKKPLVLTCHGFGIFYRDVKKPVEIISRLILHYSDMVICVSNMLCTKMLSKGLIGRDEIIVIPNGARINPYLNDKYSLRSEWGFNSTDRIALFVGTLDERKNTKDLILATSQAIKSIPSLKVLIVGGGPLKNKLQGLVNTLNINDHVIFSGRVDSEHLMQAYALSDIFVLPSSFEGLPIAVLDAMASGLPPVVTSIPGNRELVENGKNGILVEFGDVNSLADGIVKIFFSESMLNFLSKNCLELIKKKYTWGVVANEHVSVYEQVLGG